MKKIILGIAALFAVIIMPLGLHAADNAKALCEGSGGTWVADASLANGGSCDTGGPSVAQIIQQVGNVLIFIVGAVSVIMLIIGGIRYTVSQGDQAAVAGAKNTILYSIIGLVVAFISYAAVNFIISAFNIK